MRAAITALDTATWGSVKVMIGGGAVDEHVRPSPAPMPTDRTPWRP
jgi:hypothetical protein